MQTDTVFAYQVENNDHIVIDGETKGYVYFVTEEGDFILLDVVDEEGEHTQFPFGPFDNVTIVSSFEDEDVTEDVFIDL